MFHVEHFEQSVHREHFEHTEQSVPSELPKLGFDHFLLDPRRHFIYE